MHELPTGWEYRRVDQVGDVQLGRQRSPAMMTGPYMRPYLRVANVLDGHIDYSDVYEMNFTPSEVAIYGLRPGDILLNEGQDFSLVGRCAIFDGPLDMCFQNTLLRFRPYAVLPKFAAAIFKHWVDHGEFRKLSRQTTSIAHIGIGQFSAMSFPLAPLQEQHRIAEILDDLDLQIHLSDASVSKLEKMRIEVIRDALAKIRGDEATTTVGSLFAIKSGITLGPDRQPRESASQYLRVANVQRARIDLADVASLDASPTGRTELQLKVGDLLLVEGHANPDEIGRCALVGADAAGLLYQNHLFRLRSTEVEPEFAALWLNSDEVCAYWRRMAATSSGLYTINSRMLRSVPFPAADRAVQADIINSHRLIFDRITFEQDRLTKLRTLKRGFMDDLLSGRVRVPL